LLSKHIIFKWIFSVINFSFENNKNWLRWIKNNMIEPMGTNWLPDMITNISFPSTLKFSQISLSTLIETLYFIYWGYRYIFGRVVIPFHTASNEIRIHIYLFLVLSITVDTIFPLSSHHHPSCVWRLMAEHYF